MDHSGFATAQGGVYLPGPSCSGNWVLGECIVPGGLWSLMQRPIPGCCFRGVPWGHSPRCAVCLLWGADLRLWYSWQMWTFQDPRKTCLVTGSLLTVRWKMQSLGLRSEQPLAFWLWLLHLCLSGERTLNSSWLALLWNLRAHKSLFCEHARGHHVVVEPFARKVLFLFLSLWWSYGLGCYVSLVPSDCLQGIRAWSLP